jgi:hypothetical protein
VVVSAVVVRHDIGWAERGHDFPELGHRDLLAAEVIDPSQQHNVGRHPSIMSGQKKGTSESSSAGASGFPGECPEPDYAK